MDQYTAVRDDEGWRFASVNPETGTSPVGYCPDHEAHPTEEDARACYRQWQRDHILLTEQYPEWGPCSVDGCAHRAMTGASINGDSEHTARLCPEHLGIFHAVRALDLSSPTAPDSTAA